LAMHDVWTSAPSKEREVIGLLIADWWTRSILHNVVTVRQGATTEQFIRDAAGKYLPGSGGADEVIVSGHRVAHRATNLGLTNGATQLESITRVWKEDAPGSEVNIAVKSSGGDQREFEYWKIPRPAPDSNTTLSPDGLFGNDENYTKGHRLKRWRFQRGVDLDLSYEDPKSYPSSPDTISIQSSLGYSLSAPVLDVPGGYVLHNAAGGIYKVTYTAPATECPGADVMSSSGPLISEIFDPTDSVTPILRYAYDCTARVKTIEDANAIRNTGSAPYDILIAPGYRGERSDPLGGNYSVEFLRAGSETRHTDETGNVTLSYFNGFGHVTERVAPEGQRTLFDYDDNENVIKRTLKARPGSGLPDLVAQAGYNAAWNKPAWIIDQNGGRTDFAYVGAAPSSLFSGAGRGEIATVDQATVNGVRPRYAYGYNAKGQVTTMTDPELTIHRTTYDDRGFPSCTIVDDGGLNISTGYEFSDKGDLITTVDPRGMDRTWCADGQRLPPNAGGN
ncbi:MAG TPA: hypothetical protein VNH64_11665, partial [Parvularculaceae bacterium]|nr:hypothetical protein [Parvularculaceae bacterium]